ncbi:hypothetical protein SAMN06265376_101170 [Dokdonia pacifica]|uniref:Uncharacterized protein n=1 Tax=Dokdonia pacifica TaxID=1627892 RepID=A0A238VQ26_9FLAO|nr:hypothetical protein SAMN06265376_101170 [Dokdonia pacifica]
MMICMGVMIVGAIAIVIPIFNVVLITIYAQLLSTSIYPL